MDEVTWEGPETELQELKKPLVADSKKTGTSDFEPQTVEFFQNYVQKHYFL